MPLQGTFDVLSFADVLHLLGRKGMTGRLHLRNRSMGANVYLDDGKLVGADLGEHSTNSAVDIHGRLEEICFELLEAERGSFEFLPDTMGMGPATVNLEVDVVLDRARKRLDEWRLIQAVIPSLDLHPQVVDSLPADEVTLSRERWRLITAMDGRRSIRAIARSVGLTEYDTCRMVKSLMDEGVVELIGPQRGAPGVSREPVLIVDEEAEEYDESEVSESGPAEGSEPRVDRQAMTASPGTVLTTTPAVPPPTAQDPPKKGRSGIVRIGKRPRPTAPS
ncbi:MAG TPA: DUF4388 domain-containing protein [Acidimicrobiales bacterium]|nr:DUF4388 domain-containing protein [Acidimicrobiales bacterium]